MTFIKTFFKNSIIIDFIIAFVVFISVNIIILKVIINKKIDLTEDKLYTLSSNTKSVIEELNEQNKNTTFFLRVTKQRYSSNKRL